MSILFEMASDINYRENNGEHKTTNSLVLLTGRIRVFRDTLNPSLHRRRCRPWHLRRCVHAGMSTSSKEEEEAYGPHILMHLRLYLTESVIKHFTFSALSFEVRLLSQRAVISPK